MANRPYQRTNITAHSPQANALGEFAVTAYSPSLWLIQKLLIAVKFLILKIRMKWSKIYWSSLRC
jgi:hypothetical protein